MVDFHRLPQVVQDALLDLQTVSANCKSFTMNVCLSYGGRQEILQAAVSLATDAQHGVIDPTKDITEESFAARLTSHSMPDPDLLIRTSGECRLSNFLLWQLAYTELFFISKLWPDISQDDLRDVLRQYNRRDRRYGI